MAKKDKLVICPFCSSDNVVIKRRNGYTVMISLMLFFLPLPVFKKCYYCFDCDKEWKINDKLHHNKKDQEN